MRYKKKAEKQRAGSASMFFRCRFPICISYKHQEIRVQNKILKLLCTQA